MTKSKSNRLVGSTWGDSKGRTWEVVEMVKPNLYAVRTTDRTRVGEMNAASIRNAIQTSHGLEYAETKPIAGVKVASGFYISKVGPGHDIAQVHLTASQSREEQEAFAKLFVASPDLLASCEELVANLIAGAKFGLNDEEVAMLRRAEAAITKAKP